MKLFPCITILICTLSAISCCCIPSKPALWDCKAKKMEEMMEKMDFLMEKKLEMKHKLQMYKNRKMVMGVCGKLPCDCEFVFGYPIESFKPKELYSRDHCRQPCGGFWGYS